MKVQWSLDAAKDLAEIYQFVWSDNPAAARRLRATIKKAAARLASTPHIGRPGIFPGSRELIPHPGYRVIDEVVDNVVRIAGIVHTSRQWPPVDGSD